MSLKKVNFSSWLMKPLDLKIGNGKGRIFLENRLSVFPILVLVILFFAALLYRNNVITKYENSTEKFFSKHSQSKDYETQTPTFALENPKQTCIYNAQIPDTPKSWRIYNDTTFGYSIRFPNTWKLERTIDAEKDHMIVLTKGDETAKFSKSRKVPAIFISLLSPYSTSGALCANQYCEYVEPLIVNIRDQECSVPLIQGSVDYYRKKELDFYTFEVKLPELEYTSEHYTWPLSVYATVSFIHNSDKDEILRIISSMEY